MKKKKRFIRITAVLFAAALAMPATSYAKEAERISGKIHHIHTGSPEEGGGCYGEEVRHIHQGSGEKGGECFLAPVYHVHRGNERGGECYQKEIVHVHRGTEEAGKGCYGEPVYHKHEGSANAKGGCYSQPVYHKHTGSTAGKGGCYHQPVYHVHTGSQTAKGGCYGQPVYHVHSGNASSKGGCYQKAVYHVHAGNETSGGGCYEPVTHQHTDSCYREEECTMKYEGNFQKVREESGYCYHHGNTLVMHFKGIFSHMDCGMGTTEGTHSTCWTCQHMNKTHTYRRIVCGKTDKTVEKYRRVCGKETSTVESWEIGCGKNGSSVEKYELNCGKNEKTVISYEKNCGKNESTVDSYKTGCGKTETSIEKYRLNCGKTQTDVDAYALSCVKDAETIDEYNLSCGKTEETVDKYALSCEKSEDESYAEFLVVNQHPEWTGKDVVLQAAVHDPEGFLQLPESPFLWKGKEAEGISADEVKVKENGIYYVRLLAENADVDKKELVLSIEVRNIDVTAPAIEGISYSGQGERKSDMIYVTAKDVQPDGSPGSGLASEAYSFDGGKSWQKENGMEWKAGGTVSIAVRDQCGNVSVQNIEIKDIGNEDKDSGEETEETEKKEEGTEETEKREEETEETEKKEEETEESEKKEEETEGTGKNEEKKEETGKKEEGEKDKEGNSGGNPNGSTGGDTGRGSGSENKQNENQGAGLAKMEEGNEEDKQPDEKEPMKKGKSNSEKKKKTEGKEKSEEEEKENGTEKTGKRKIRIPDKRKTYEKETVQAKVPENAAMPEEGSHIRVAKQAEAAGRVVKAVTFTISGIMLASGMLYLIYLMFRSIQVYDCDGEGKARYAGSCIMKRTGDGFEVKIPDMIWEHSATGQYSLRPGRTFVKRNKGKELTVIAGEQRGSVWIDREIPFRVTMHV